MLPQGWKDKLKGDGTCDQYAYPFGQAAMKKADSNADGNGGEAEARSGFYQTDVVSLQVVPGFELPGPDAK